MLSILNLFDRLVRSEILSHSQSFFNYSDFNLFFLFFSSVTSFLPQWEISASAGNQDGKFRITWNCGECCTTKSLPMLSTKQAGWSASPPLDIFILLTCRFFLKWNQRNLWGFTNFFFGFGFGYFYYFTVSIIYPPTLEQKSATFQGI